MGQATAIQDSSPSPLKSACVKSFPRTRLWKPLRILTWSKIPVREKLRRLGESTPKGLVCRVRAVFFLGKAPGNTVKNSVRESFRMTPAVCRKCNEAVRRESGDPPVCQKLGCGQFRINAEQCWAKNSIVVPLPKLVSLLVKNSRLAQWVKMVSMCPEKWRRPLPPVILLEKTLKMTLLNCLSL